MKKSNRPFFSIIVPCYQSRPYIIKLLDSFVAQKMSEKDLEIILVDDNSSSNYVDRLVDYVGRLNIKFFKSEKEACPGNTREYGVSKATGEWITFVDHDDILAPNILKRIKKLILKYKEPYYVVTNFIQSDFKTNQVLKIFEEPLGWLHGKFYNLDNFWKKYNIHFPENMKSQEDTAICAQCNCIMEHLNRTPFYIKLFTYVWYDHTNSLSNKKYLLQNNESNNKEIYNSYFEVNFKDYINSTGEVYIQAEKDRLITEESAICGIIEVITMCYFYIMKFIFDNPEFYLKENIDYVKEFYQKTKKQYNFTKEDVYDSLAYEGAKFYNTVKDQADIIAHDCIPSMTIKEFLDLIDQKDIIKEEDKND